MLPMGTVFAINSNQKMKMKVITSKMFYLFDIKNEQIFDSKQLLMQFEKSV